MGERPRVMVAAMARPLNMVNMVNMVNLVALVALAVENRDRFYPLDAEVSRAPLQAFRTASCTLRSRVICFRSRTLSRLTKRREMARGVLGLRANAAVMR